MSATLNVKDTFQHKIRIRQSRIDKDRFRADIEYTDPDGRPVEADSSFEFELTLQDQEDIRWYLEDYLQQPHDPAGAIAARIEQRMKRIGLELFSNIFDANRDCQRIWDRIHDQLQDTRVEILTEVQEATSIPWELMREPTTDRPIALSAQSFVRSTTRQATVQPIPTAQVERIRILLVICRPAGRTDVPFRSVAGQLIRRLSTETKEMFQLDVLRPATFDNLAKVLQEAKGSGTPYHIVHFDGHGTYAELKKDKRWRSRLRDGINTVTLGAAKAGPHGYLLFENPKLKENVEPVDGTRLGKLLVKTSVGVLVMNACQSAYAEPPEKPVDAAAAESMNVHDMTRASGSLAQEVSDCGVPGVVAMRYSVYVVTAAKFVVEMYGHLLKGASLAQAVSLGRYQLDVDPYRQIAYERYRLQDWCVPIVHEAAPIKLFMPSVETEKLKVDIKAGPSAKGDVSGIDPSLPPEPDVGFFGRDAVILEVDRAFDTEQIVLLHALAGAGKTTTAAEFARWYWETGGVRGPVLFTSFERRTVLKDLLLQFGDMFATALEQAGVNWSAKTETRELRDIALQVMRQVPLLWIWDNVEPVAGFPTGTESEWTKPEQKELADFLRAAKATQAKFLLTSRRDEKKWLRDLPRRVKVGPMPMQEMGELARAIAEHRGVRIAEVRDWGPLLEYAGGNPLTVTVVVKQALREGLTGRDTMERFVEQLQSGRKAIADEDEALGRSHSLAASLKYGFEKAFDEAEQKQLALLHLFQAVVNVDVLQWMGVPEVSWHLEQIKGLTREQWISLLDQAVEVGLLSKIGTGYYSIHPALPWFFKGLFDQYYPAEYKPDDAHYLKATRAYAEAIGYLGHTLWKRYESGERDISALTAEEANLLFARRLAIRHDWPHIITSAMQGLYQLYARTGRRKRWRTLVDEIVPLFVDAKTDGPLSGKEDQWSIVTQYRMHLARQDREWQEAQRLQEKAVEWDRGKAELLLDIPVDKLTDDQKNTIRSLGASYHELAEIQRAQGDQECVTSYMKDLELSERIEDQPGAATTAFNLGTAFKNIRPLRDLDQAEQWYKYSLERYPEHDYITIARCKGQLGSVAYERFKEARDAGKDKKEVLAHLNEARNLYHEALALLPDDAVDDLGVAHTLLGNIYLDANDLQKSLDHWRKSIHYREVQGDLYGAGAARYNVAVALAGRGRFDDALDYAKAALENFQHYGQGAAQEVQKAESLIKEIRGLKEQAEN